MKYRKVIFFIVVFFSFQVVANSVWAQEKCTGNQIFTAKNCAGDTNSADEKALYDIVNKYRVANGRPAIRLSVSLSMLANRRMLDLQQNLKTLTHSWSNCSYDINDKKTWPCVIDAPTRLNCGYKGQGYETLYRTSSGAATSALALDAWKKSSLHSSIILNKDIFQKMAWDEVGVAIDGQYAALWFGYPGSGSLGTGGSVAGLGVSYEQAVAGLSKILSIDQKSSSIENNIWQGFSTDRKIKLEIYGTRKEINEANVGITVKLEPDGKLDSKNQIVLATLLKNLFPEWQDIDMWISGAINLISQNQTAWKTKLVRKIAIELKSDGPNSLKLSVKPQSKPSYIQVF